MTLIYGTEHLQLLYTFDYGAGLPAVYRVAGTGAESFAPLAVSGCEVALD